MAIKMASNFKSAPKAAEDRPRALAEGIGNRAIDAHQVKLRRLVGAPDQRSIRERNSATIGLLAQHLHEDSRTFAMIVPHFEPDTLAHPHQCRLLSTSDFLRRQGQPWAQRVITLIIGSQPSGEVVSLAWL
jgi:hypothetical protein